MLFKGLHFYRRNFKTVYIVFPPHCFFDGTINCYSFMYIYVVNLYCIVAYYLYGLPSAYMILTLTMNHTD